MPHSLNNSHKHTDVTHVTVDCSLAVPHSLGALGFGRALWELWAVGASPPQDGGIRRVAAQLRVRARRSPVALFCKLLTSIENQLFKTAEMSNFDGQYVVASLDVSGRPDGDAQAHLVSVTTPVDVLRVQVPGRFQPLLMAAKNDATQHRFHFTFESPAGAGALPIVSAASLIELDGSEQPIATHAGCIGCPEEPFDYGTGQWAPAMHSLLVRNATTDVRSLVSQRCSEVLRQSDPLPADHPLLQFDANLNFRESDADLFQPTAPQRFLDRATLPDVWRRSSWSQRQGQLLNCPPDSVRSRNIQLLQDAFISSCSPAFHAFQRIAAASPSIQRQFLLGGGSTNGRDKHCLLDCAGESHMDRVHRNMLQECRGDGHPLTASFQEARRQRNAAGAGPERELPFLLERAANSFAVHKLYVIRMRGNLGQLQLSPNALVQTNAFDPRTFDASHWSPRFQQLADEAERLGPGPFHRLHRMGLVFGDHHQPSHAAQVCVGNAWSACDRGGNWFQELWQRTESVPMQDCSGAHAAEPNALQPQIATLHPESDDQVRPSDLAALAHEIAALGLRDGA